MPPASNTATRSVAKSSPGAGLYPRICNSWWTPVKTITTDSPVSKSPPIIVPDWPAPENVVAFTTTRCGGVSGAPYDSFNLALHVGDEAAKVQQNRQILKSHFCLPNEPVWLEQIHGTSVVSLARPAGKPLPADPPRADGAVSAQRGVVCAVMTADCMPLFLSNKAGTRVGVIHAGWRGLANGIIEQGVSALNEPADQVLAWAGPTIGQMHFEIDNEVREQLGGPDQAYAASTRPGKCHADLYQLAAFRLQALGVAQYGHSRHCTFAEAGYFYSYRRDQQGGRMASLIYRR
ncbi:MAG: peptidoglycan editing factor PgeF [Gammaproteobacteria bacterium]|nr:peptidoglycan editing factor PgeF [Gammaproteobacteria bacterium]